VTYSCRVFNSIDEIVADDWQRVQSPCDERIAIDRRFIAAVESSMKHKCTFRYVVVYDENGLPAACAALSTITVDVANYAHPFLAWVIRRVPILLSRLRQLKILLCGSPIPTGQPGLGLRQPSASAQILLVLDKVVCELAAEMKADAVVYKEFEKGDLDWINSLRGLKYSRIATPPVHFFTRPFDSFSSYCAALKARYRKHINRSQRKLQGKEIRLTVMTDPQDMLRAYTPEVHGLYHQMAARAKVVKQDFLPIEFFQQLARRFAGQIELITFIAQSRTIAFGWCLRCGSTYYLLVSGVDYNLNHEFDLYFNLMYAAFDRAFQRGIARINAGMGADAFKARLGCHSEPVYVFAKGNTPVLSLVVRVAANLLIARTPVVPPPDIFRSNEDDNSV
jgi:predicted N-acyltransferase